MRSAPFEIAYKTLVSRLAAGTGRLLLKVDKSYLIRAKTLFKGFSSTFLMILKTGTLGVTRAGHFLRTADTKILLRAGSALGGIAIVFVGFASLGHRGTTDPEQGSTPLRESRTSTSELATPKLYGPEVIDKATDIAKCSGLYIGLGGRMLSTGRDSAFGFTSKEYTHIAFNYLDASLSLIGLRRGPMVETDPNGKQLSKASQDGMKYPMGPFTADAMGAALHECGRYRATVEDTNHRGFLKRPAD